MIQIKTVNTAISAAIKAGHEILNIYNDPEADFSIERKADNSPLTIADKAAHNIIAEYLIETGLPLLSEEGKAIPYVERKNWHSFWMVDPLDGTKEFIKKNGEFTVNIALIEENRPVLGVIYVPVLNTLYFGEKSRGAWKMVNIPNTLTFESISETGKKLPLQNIDSNYKIVGSRSHMSNETKQYIDGLRRNHSQIDIISKGSSLKICMVAEGTANEYPRFAPTMEWDTAAGHAIANAAGKKLWLNNLSSELTYNKKDLLNPWFIVK